MSEHNSTKRARTSSTSSLLLEHGFVRDELMPALTDRDVLTRLLVAGKPVTTWLKRYVVKSLVDYDTAIKLLHSNHRVQLVFKQIRLTHVDSLNFDLLPNLAYIQVSCNPSISAGAIPANGVKVMFMDTDFDQPIVPGAIPNTVEHLFLGYVFDQHLELGSIPTSVVQLDFSEMFNQPLSVGLFPDGLKSLAFGTCFDQPLEPGMLPKTIKRLLIGELSCSQFNQSLSEGVLPDSLQILRFHSDVKNALQPNCLLNSLTELELIYYEDLPVGILPSSLKKFRFQSESIIPLKPFKSGFFPCHLTHLQLVGCFNTNIEPGVLPDTLTHLIFGELFDQKFVPGSLPPSLIHIEFGNSFSHELVPGVLPPNIMKLGFGKRFSNAVVPAVHLFTSVRYLKICYMILLAWLPRNVTHLTLSCEEKLSSRMIPNHITHLTLTGDFHQGCPSLLDIVPTSVTHLNLAVYLGQLDDDMIPSTVTHLILSDLFFDLESVDPNLFRADVVFQSSDRPDGIIWYDPDDETSFRFTFA